MEFPSLELFRIWLLETEFGGELGQWLGSVLEPFSNLYELYSKKNLVQVGVVGQDVEAAPGRDG